MGMQFQLKSRYCHCDDLFLDIMANQVVTVVQFNNQRIHGPIPLPSSDDLHGITIPSDRDRLFLIPFEIQDESVTDLRIKNRGNRTPAMLFILFHHHVELTMVNLQEWIHEEIAEQLSAKTWNLANLTAMQQFLDSSESLLNDLLYQKFKERILTTLEQKVHQIKEKLTSLARTRNLLTKSKKFSPFSAAVTQHRRSMILFNSKFEMNELLSNFLPPVIDENITWSFERKSPHVHRLIVADVEYYLCRLNALHASRMRDDSHQELDETLIEPLLTLLEPNEMQHEKTPMILYLSSHFIHDNTVKQLKSFLSRVTRILDLQQVIIGNHDDSKSLKNLMNELGITTAIQAMAAPSTRDNGTNMLMTGIDLVTSFLLEKIEDSTRTYRQLEQLKRKEASKDWITRKRERRKLFEG